MNKPQNPGNKNKTEKIRRNKKIKNAKTQSVTVTIIPGIQVQQRF